MTALAQVHANQLIDASAGTTVLPVTVTPLRCRLMTANGTPTSPGTELAASGGYTGGATAPSVTFSAANVSAPSSSTLTVTNMPAATIVGVELWDSSTVPVRKWYGPLISSKVTNSGDTFTIAVAALTLALG